MTEEMNIEMADVKVLKVGDILNGLITKVEDKAAYVNIGYKVDGLIPLHELSNLSIEHANEAVEVGQELELKVLKVSDEEVVLSKKAVQAAKAWETLQQVFETKSVVEAVVSEIVKGGLVVDVGVRGFVPGSQVERYFVEDFSEYKGRTLRLKVMELDKEKNRVVLSQRAVLEEEGEAKKLGALNKLQVGNIVEGTVQRLADFGAFIDLGGIDGLVHISQIAHQRVGNPSEVLKEGDLVKVKILSVDPGTSRISLSIKDTLPGPWEAANKINPGDIVEGEVRRLVTFGAFVEIVPGVEGLVHISQITNRHISSPGDALKVGEKVKAKVLDVNIADKRISLSIRELLEEAEKVEIPSEYKKNEETSGFSLADVIGDQLKKFR